MPTTTPTPTPAERPVDTVPEIGPWLTTLSGDFRVYASTGVTAARCFHIDDGRLRWSVWPADAGFAQAFGFAPDIDAARDAADAALTRLHARNADTVPTGYAASRALADIAALLGMPQDATPTEVVEAVRARTSVPVPTTIGDWECSNSGRTHCRGYQPSGELAATVSQWTGRFAWGVWRDGAVVAFALGTADTLEAARDAADRALGIVP